MSESSKPNIPLESPEGTSQQNAAESFWLSELRQVRKKASLDSLSSHENDTDDREGDKPEHEKGESELSLEEWQLLRQYASSSTVKVPRIVCSSRRQPSGKSSVSSMGSLRYGAAKLTELRSYP